MIAITWPTRKLPRDALVDATDLGILAVAERIRIYCKRFCYEGMSFSSDVSASKIFLCQDCLTDF